MALGVEVEQCNLLFILVVTGHQHLIAQGAAVQPGKGALYPTQGVALFIQQQQAFTLACRQTFVTRAIGQETQGLGLAGGPLLQGRGGDIGGSLDAACGQAGQQGQEAGFAFE